MEARTGGRWEVEGITGTESEGRRWEVEEGDVRRGRGEGGGERPGRVGRSKRRERAEKLREVVETVWRKAGAGVGAGEMVGEVRDMHPVLRDAEVWEVEEAMDSGIHGFGI